MSEAVREMTYDEMIVNAIMNILALDVPMGVRRDLISHILSLSYRHEREVINALREARNEHALNKTDHVEEG